MSPVTFAKPNPDNWIDHDCPICFEEMTPEDSVTHVTDENVQHIFHDPCLRDWFKHGERFIQKPTCPTCRRVVTVFKDSLLMPPSDLHWRSKVEWIQKSFETVYNIAFFEDRYYWMHLDDFDTAFPKLYLAAKTGDIVTVNEWMENTHAGYRLGSICEALVIASKYGHTEVVQILMKEDGISWPCYITAHDLAAQNHHEAVQQLFSYPLLSRSFCRLVISMARKFCVDVLTAPP